MSDALTRTDFENLMDEYLRGELSATPKTAFEQYLELHPEDRGELDEVRSILAITAEAADCHPPEDLLQRARAGLAHQLRSTSTGKTGWFKRPAFAWSLAASILLVFGLALWPTDSSFVYARLIESLNNVESVKVEGWIRGENGATVPYCQWVIADGTLRAEIGEGDNQRVVVLKGNNRLIRDSDGKLYHDKPKVRWAENLDGVLTILQAAHQNPQVPLRSFEFSKQDLGDVIRYIRRDFASLGRGPSNRKWVMEVDKQTALPTLLQLHQEVDGHWIQISDLRFSAPSAPPSDDFFHLDGDAASLNDQDRQHFWFELYIAPGSLFLPALHVPDGGLQLHWPKVEDVPAGISGGNSSLVAAGISSHEFRECTLKVIAKELTGYNVVANDLAQQPVSLLFDAKTILPWQEKLAPVLEHLALAYEMVPIKQTQRKYIFHKDEQAIQTTLHRFSSSSVTAKSSGYTYHFEKVELQRVARTLLDNCAHQDFFTENDVIEFAWDGAPEANPFLLFVDLDCEIPQATFETNVEFLKEHFGLTMTMEETQTETMEIKLVRM